MIKGAIIAAALMTLPPVTEEPPIIISAIIQEPEVATVAKPAMEAESDWITVEVMQFELSEPHLTKQGGVFYGESGKETFYNLDMSGCISIMRGLGYSEADYPYWIREDGVKMFGDYVMIAANTYQNPKGSLMETSLGTGMVVDHCVAAQTQQIIDIAVTW